MSIAHAVLILGCPVCHADSGNRITVAPPLLPQSFPRLICKDCGGEFVSEIDKAGVRAWSVESGTDKDLEDFA
jgi:hypothetical protein